MSTATQTLIEKLANINVKRNDVKRFSNKVKTEDKLLKKAFTTVLVYTGGNDIKFRSTTERVAFSISQDIEDSGKVSYEVSELPYDIKLTGLSVVNGRIIEVLDGTEEFQTEAEKPALFKHEISANGKVLFSANLDKKLSKKDALALAVGNKTYWYSANNDQMPLEPTLVDNLVFSVFSGEEQLVMNVELNEILPNYTFTVDGEAITYKLYMIDGEVNDLNEEVDKIPEANKEEVLVPVGQEQSKGEYHISKEDTVQVTFAIGGIRKVFTVDAIGLIEQLTIGHYTFKPLIGMSKVVAPLSDIINNNVIAIKQDTGEKLDLGVIGGDWKMEEVGDLSNIQVKYENGRVVNFGCVNGVTEPAFKDIHFALGTKTWNLRTKPSASPISGFVLETETAKHFLVREPSAEDPKSKEFARFPMTGLLKNLYIHFQDAPPQAMYSCDYDVDEVEVVDCLVVTYSTGEVENYVCFKIEPLDLPVQPEAPKVEVNPCDPLSVIMGAYNAN